MRIGALAVWLSAAVFVTTSAHGVEPVRIGVMEFLGIGEVPQYKADVLADIITENISRLGNVLVLSKSDIHSMLNIEKQKRLAGCADSSCISEIAGALDMPWMVTGNVTRFGGIYLLNLKLFDVRNTMVLGRVTRKVKGDEGDLLDDLPEAVQELFDRVAPRMGIHLPNRITAAAKHSQPITESPASVMVITRKEIEESGAFTIMDLLRRYPPLHVYVFDPIYPMLETRGTLLILLMIDGREVNLEIYWSPFYTALPIGINDVERIEVVLGPNSALYGANAVAAVVNIITREPAAGVQAGLAIAAGGHGNSVIEGSVGGGSGPLAARGSFGIDAANSWMDRRLLSKNMKRGNATLRLDLPDGSLTLNGGLVIGGGRMYATIGYMDFEEFLLAHSQAELEIGGLKARLYWYGVRTTLDLDLDLFLPDTDILLARLPTSEIDGDVLEIQAQYELSLFENNLLLAGADLRFNSYSCQTFVDPELFETRFGLYLHDEQRFAERIILTLGARLDLNSKTKLAISPRAALLYNPAGEHYLRLSAGMAFRKPTMVETSANFKVQPEPGFPEIKVLFEEQGLSNPDLSNETLTTVELGYRGYWLEKSLRIDTNAYLGFYRNFIGFRTDIRFDSMMRIDLQNSQFGFDNFGDDRNIVGFSFHVEGEPIEALTLFLRGEYRYDWDIGGAFWSEQSANLLGCAGISLRLPFGLTAHLAVSHVGGRQDEVRNPDSILAPAFIQHLPPITFFLGAIAYRQQVGRSTLRVGVNFFNPFGKGFRENAGTYSSGGSNYGGELLGSRVVFWAGLEY